MIEKTNEMNSVLVVAAHPDDEILGCGGTIARLSKEGHKVCTLILGEGITSRDEKRDRAKRDKEIAVLKKNIGNANRIINVKDIRTFDFPDNRFDAVPLLDIVKVIENVKKEVNPDVVYTHHHGDLNIDHRITFNAVLTAFRPLKGESVKNIYSFEVPSSTEWPSDNGKYFIPNYFVNIKDTINEKIEAMGAYTSEVRDFPHPRSIKALEILAQRRGIIVGYEYAEAFVLVRGLRD